MSQELEKSELFKQDGPEGEIHSTKRIKKINRKYLINIALVLLVTGIVLYINLNRNIEIVSEALKNTNPSYIGLTIGLVFFSYFLDGLILYILARLYTTRFTFKKAQANAMIGHFYNNVTPGASGGQFAQAYTFKQQGLELSNAASILVMHFLINQIVLVIFGLVALAARLPHFIDIIEPIELFGVSFPTITLSLFGFALNFVVIASIFFLGYSKFLHNLFINGIVGLLGKMKLIRHPETTKANLQIQIENFRIELRRLQSNIPVTVVLFLIFFVKYFVVYSLPYFISISISTITISGNLWDFVFMASYLNVITNLAPLPGSAGFSELFFSHLFQSLLGSYAATVAPQIIWRAITFYMTFIISGLTAAFYRSAPQEDNFKSDRRTFVDLQRSTLAIRKKSSDTAWETAQLSRKEMEAKLKKSFFDPFGVRARLLAKKKKQLDTEENIKITSEKQINEKLTVDTGELNANTDGKSNEK